MSGYERDSLTADELVYRASEPASVHVVEKKGDGPIVVEGRMMPWNEWTEVRSSIEGHFLERFLPGSLRKTIDEQGHRVRALWEHGLDTVLGRQAIANVDELREEEDGAYFRATLLDGLPKLLVSGIRAGLYGSSIRFRPVKFDRDPRPKRSAWNPDGIEEVTVREAFMKEFSITPFPQYAGATAAVAGMRSITDEVTARKLLADPVRLLEIMDEIDGEPASPFRAEPVPPHEPPHSPPAPPPVDPADAGSRSTRLSRDYLIKEDTKWVL